MFWSIFESLCKEKEISPNAACKEMGLGTSVATYWKQGSWPRQKTLEKIADFFGYTVEEIVKMKGKEDPDVIYNPQRDLNGLYFFARYYLGKEDANTMFNIAGIDMNQWEEKIKNSKPKNGQLKSIEFPDEISISPNAFDWISAHCDISPIYFHMKTPISRNDIIEPNFYYGTAENTKTVEEVIKTPEIAEMEREFLKRKREKCVLQTEEPTVQKQQWGLFNKQYEGLMREIIDGYEEVIYQFGGDIGAQFVLLDRFRQAADKLSKEIASRKELA